jgi:hypothetical protein
MRGLVDLQADRDELLQEYGFAHLEEASGRDERRERVVERKRKDEELATLFSSMLRGEQVREVSTLPFQRDARALRARLHPRPTVGDVWGSNSRVTNG